MRGALRGSSFAWEGTASMRGAVRGSVKGCCRARRRALPRRSLFSLINFLPRTVPRPAVVISMENHVGRRRQLKRPDVKRDFHEENQHVDSQHVRTQTACLDRQSDERRNLSSFRGIRLFQIGLLGRRRWNNAWSVLRTRKKALKEESKVTQKALKVAKQKK